LCLPESPGSSSAGDTGSDEDDNEMGGDMSKLQEMAMGTGLSQEAISKAKQSKSERKARKVMLKLGLKPCQGVCVCVHAMCLHVDIN